MMAAPDQRRIAGGRPLRRGLAWLVGQDAGRNAAQRRGIVPGLGRESTERRPGAPNGGGRRRLGEAGVRARLPRGRGRRSGEVAARAGPDLRRPQYFGYLALAWSTLDAVRP